VIAPAIPFERIKKFLGADSIIVNMASGFDITLETLDVIRMEVRPRSTPIHFDYHNLSMGVSGESERFRRPIPDWRRWAFMNASVQLNEAEALGLALEKLTEPQIVGHFLTLGVHGVLITRGAGGSSVFTSEHKKVLRRDFLAEGSASGHDMTGLGDIFGAAFAFQYAQKADMVAAAEFANLFAGMAAALPRAERCAPPPGTTRSPR
jgi:sugar/nucleoside kinase (ribokinase family)